MWWMPCPGETGSNKTGAVHFTREKKSLKSSECFRRCTVSLYPTYPVHAGTWLRAALVIGPLLSMDGLLHFGLVHVCGLHGKGHRSSRSILGPDEDLVASSSLWALHHTELSWTPWIHVLLVVEPGEKSN